jgi:hypothetical protein
MILTEIEMDLRLNYLLTFILAAALTICFNLNANKAVQSTNNYAPAVQVVISMPPANSATVIAADSQIQSQQMALALPSNTAEDKITGDNHSFQHQQQP